MSVIDDNVTDIVQSVLNDYDDDVDIQERVSESIDPYLTYWSDCHEIVQAWDGDTGQLEVWGKDYNAIATGYAYQILEQEVHEALENEGSE